MLQGETQDCELKYFCCMFSLFSLAAECSTLTKLSVLLLSLCSPISPTHPPHSARTFRGALLGETRCSAAPGMSELETWSSTGTRIAWLDPSVTATPLTCHKLSQSFFHLLYTYDQISLIWLIIERFFIKFINHRHIEFEILCLTGKLKSYFFLISCWFLCSAKKRRSWIYFRVNGEKTLNLFK